MSVQRHHITEHRDNAMIDNDIGNTAPANEPQVTDWTVLPVAVPVELKAKVREHAPTTKQKNASSWVRSLIEAALARVDRRAGADRRKAA